MFGWVQAVEAQFTFTTNNGAITITGYNTAAGLNMVIPAATNGYPVTSIGDNAFYGSAITSVTIPDSVTNIGSTAFEYCYNLTSVTIPDNVTSIGEEVFEHCITLTSVTIPDSVTSIGEEAFIQCSSLTNIIMDEENLFFSSTNGVLFDKNQTTLIQYPGGLVGSYTIPNSVTSIGLDAFFFCTSLTSVAIPNSVTNIGNGAFAHSSLTSVTIPDSVTNISEGAFANTSLSSIVIPNSVTSIELAAFYECSSLTSVTIGRSVTSIGQDAFGVCPALTSVSFFGNAPAIDSRIFDGDKFANMTVYYAPGTTGWAAFAARVSVVTAPQFGSTVYGGLPVFFYPTNGVGNTLQLSTNSASGNWVTVSNAITLAALQLTNAPSSAFFRLQSSGGSAPNVGLSQYFGQPVLFYPTNAAYSPQMATNLAAPNWTSPSGNAFIALQVTNASPNAVFRLH